MARDFSDYDVGDSFAYQRDNTESKGVGRSGFMDYSSLSGVKMFEMDPDARNQSINIIPYTIATKNHPHVRSGRRKVGQWDYLLDVWVHKALGVNKRDMLCLKRTYGMPCAACDEMSRLYDEGEDDAAKKIKPSRRCVYIVNPVEDGKPSKDLMLFETSHFAFNKELTEEASASSDGGVVNFHDPRPGHGKVVKFKVGVNKEIGGRNGFTYAKSIEFEDREYDIRESVLDKAEGIHLDALLKVPANADIKDALFGGDDIDGAEDDDVRDEQPRRSRPADDEDLPPRRGRSAEPEDDGLSPAEPPARRRAPEPEDDDLPPRRKPAEDDEPPARKLKGDDGATFDDPFPGAPTELDEAPAKPKAAPEDDGETCPCGLRFGTDCDQDTKCGTCPDEIYNRCDACRRARAKRK